MSEKLSKSEITAASSWKYSFPPPDMRQYLVARLPAGVGGWDNSQHKDCLVPRSKGAYFYLQRGCTLYDAVSGAPFTPSEEELLEALPKAWDALSSWSRNMRAEMDDDLLRRRFPMQFASLTRCLELRKEKD